MAWHCGKLLCCWCWWRRLPWCRFQWTCSARNTENGKRETYTCATTKTPDDPRIESDGIRWISTFNVTSMLRSQTRFADTPIRAIRNLLVTKVSRRYQESSESFFKLEFFHIHENCLNTTTNQYHHHIITSSHPVNSSLSMRRANFGSVSTNLKIR